MNSLSLALFATLTAAPLTAWANTNPDFDDDATPILRMQPGLLRYVEQTFEVKDTGTAKYPGDDDRRPQPPYIFRARPIGTHGQYNLRLLIQPGTPGHILNVVDITKVHLNTPGNAPAIASRAPITPQPPRPPANPNVQVPELSAGPVDQAPAAPQTPATPQPPATTAPAEQPNEPTADTPSGPITDSGTTPQTPATPQPNLAPPSDPAPTPQ